MQINSVSTFYNNAFKSNHTTNNDKYRKYLEKKDYIDKKVFQVDPFVSLDQNGVGQLIEIAAQKGRSTRPDIKLGICGEHGGDPESIKFCHKAGLNYVSCSPYRVLVARLAAAQAAAEQIILEHNKDKVIVSDK